MKAYKLTVMVLDFDVVGGEGIKQMLEGARYPNHCIAPHVEEIEVRDIGEWNDDHPLNKRATFKAEFDRLFAKPE